MPARYLVLAALFVLGGCAFAEPFQAPEVVAGGETTVTLKSGSLRDANAFAKSYCAKYGRRAVFKASGEMSQKAVTLYIYDCLPPHTR